MFSTGIWRPLIAIVLGAHGIGHILFLVPFLGVASWGITVRSWLLGSGIVARAIGAILWVAALVAFVVAAFGFYRHGAGWQAWAIAGSVASLAGLILFWKGIPMSNKYWAALLNLIALGRLLAPARTQLRR
jgi:hypothetical protein